MLTLFMVGCALGFLVWRARNSRTLHVGVYEVFAIPLHQRTKLLRSEVRREWSDYRCPECRKARALDREPIKMNRVYECACGIVWQAEEPETAQEYAERMADLDLADEAVRQAEEAEKKKPPLSL